MLSVNVIVVSLFRNKNPYFKTWVGIVLKEEKLTNSAMKDFFILRLAILFLSKLQMAYASMSRCP